MKLTLALVAFVFIVVMVNAKPQTPATAQSTVPVTSTAQTTATTPGRTPVIVELFTSEGCSSCPPADALLAKLDSDQPLPNTEVIALEEHVDYWNQGGWFDPFSSSEWTLRQQDYASDLKSGQTFTPQMIVNGDTAFIGNHTQEAVQAIRKAVAIPGTSITIKVGTVSPKNVSGIAITVGKLADASQTPQADVWLAVTEKGLHTVVKAGENSGSDLHHAPVVRSLRKIGTADRSKDSSYSSTQNISLNSKWKTENLRLVVFVQERKSRRILGAASASLVTLPPQG